MSPNSYLNEPPRCGYQGDGPAALPPCVRHRGHLGQHDHAHHETAPAPGGLFSGVAQSMPLVRPGGNLQSYLEDLVTGGVIQTSAASPYRSEGHVIRRGQILAALATSEYEAQLIVDRTTADKLWRDKAEAARRQAKYWEQLRRVARVARHAREMMDVRGRHQRATAHIARLTAELATATAQLEGARDAAAKLTDLKQRAERIEIERSKWMGRHGELAGAALHMLRRLNTIVGDHDAPEFTRAAATEAVDKLLGQITESSETNLALLERVDHLEELLKASREAAEAAEVDRKALAAQHGAPQRFKLRCLSGGLDPDVQCVLCRDHQGQHEDEWGNHW